MKISILLFSFFASYSLFASEKTPVDCRAVLSRTLSFEWEYNGPKSTLAKSENTDPFQNFFASFQMREKEFGASAFRRLYTPQTQDIHGAWKSYQLPKRISANAAFQAFLTKYQLKLQPVDDHMVYLEGFDQVKPEFFMSACLTLGTLAHQEKITLKFRKNESEWKRTAQPMDHLIPEEASEEWRGEALLNFEFPIAGSVQTKEELRQYLKALLVRLEFFQGEDPALTQWIEQYSNGHVHWVPLAEQVAALPPRKRKTFYQAMINTWGDANDRDFILGWHALRLHPRTFSVDQRTAFKFGKVFVESLYRYFHAKPLTTEQFQEVIASPDGIILRKDPERFHLSDYKLHNIGLRFIYGGTPPQPNIPLTKPGLEIRSGQHLKDSLQRLPEPLNDEGPLLDAFLSHGESVGKRGITSEHETLQKNANKIGLPEETFAVFDEAISTVHEYYSEKYQYLRDNLISLNEIRAALFSALNDWIEHPIVQKKLQNMPPAQRKIATKKYERAQKNYKERITDLILAYQGKMQRYLPKWKKIRPLLLGKQIIENIVDPNVTLNATQEYNQNVPSELRADQTTRRLADENFIFILATENARFFQEAGLSELFQD